MPQYQRKTIEYCHANPRAGTPEGGYTVYGHDTYPESSVLGGQPRRTYLDHRETVEECQALHPDAEVIEGSTYQRPYLPKEPPAWFDPSAAGEEW